MNFRPCFDPCISGNTQPNDMKLKPLVDRDVIDRCSSFFFLGRRIDAVLVRQLARRTTKVGFVVAGLSSLINLYRVAHSEYINVGCRDSPDGSMLLWI